MSLILTSNGLTSQPIIDYFATYCKISMKNAAIVVTADPDYRTANRRAVHTQKKLLECGYNTVFYDLDFQSAKGLIRYDLAFFIGGNPFYLLRRMRETDAGHILKSMLQDGKIISGSSAGALVMGTTLKLVNEFDSQMNLDVGLHNLDGLSLTNINICPHYSKYSSRYDNFEARICNIEIAKNIEIERMNDGEALFIKDNHVQRISGAELRE